MPLGVRKLPVAINTTNDGEQGEITGFSPKSPNVAQVVYFKEKHQSGSWWFVVTGAAVIDIYIARDDDWTLVVLTKKKKKEIFVGKLSW